MHTVAKLMNKVISDSHNWYLPGVTVVKTVTHNITEDDNPPIGNNIFENKESISITCTLIYVV